MTFMQKDTWLNPTQLNEGGKTARQAGWREYGHLLFAGLFACTAIGLVALASWLLGEPAAVFTREPQGVLDGAFYVGSFSNLGALIWFGAAAILSFASSLKPFDRGALILAAIVTWAMGLDDMFMLHDRVYPKLYLNETLVSALYFGAIGVIVWRSYRQLTRATLIGIALAVSFWALSAAVDRYFNNMGQLAEDGTKFIGIVLWAAAWVRQAYHDLTTRVRSSA
jgi:hypothetical protein